MSKPETFAALLKQFEYKYDLFTVFDDFLTMSICACSRNPITGLSYDEDLYLSTVEKYKDDKTRFLFPKLFAVFTSEMNQRLNSENGFDVLGEYYEENLSRRYKGQYFTPWPICTLMAEMTLKETNEKEPPLRILDSSCGSGRMLLAASRKAGRFHYYNGIDIDHTCIKMAALNLFFGGLFSSEVMWANALLPNDFNLSYQISFHPFGILRIQDKEQSPLWHAHQSSFNESNEPEQPFEGWKEKGMQNLPGAQLDLF